MVVNFYEPLTIPGMHMLQTIKNRDIQLSPEAAEAMREHLLADEYLTLSQVKDIYTSLLRKPKVRKHLFWRYSVVWEKSLG